MYFHWNTFFRLVARSFKKENASPRHIVLAVVFPFLFFILRIFVWLCRKLDHVFYPDFTKQPLSAPIYIIGNPRSGTTFSHRLLALDKGYVSYKLWQTIFPCVILHKFFALAAKGDAALGKGVNRLLEAAGRKGFEGWSSIHKTGPTAVESDEMLFVYSFLSPLCTLLFPYFDAAKYARFADALPKAERKKLMEYYVDCLKRQMYAQGPDHVLLEKVALIAGRLNSIFEALPDMRIVYLVRHPYESIPSLISMFDVSWKALAPRAAHREETAEALAQLIFDYYRAVAEFKKKVPTDQFYELRYTDLVADPKAAVQGVYAHFGLEVTPEYDAVLTEETSKARQYKSKHSYSLEEYGLSKERVYEELKDIFEEYGFER